MPTIVKDYKTVQFAAKYYALGSTPDLLIEWPVFVVMAAKPCSLRIEELRNRSSKNKRRDFTNKSHVVLPFNVFVSDGENQYELATASNAYIKGKAASSLSSVVGVKGLPSVIAPDVIFADDPLHDFVPIRSTEFKGEPAVVYARTISHSISRDGQNGTLTEEQRLYVSVSDDTPIMLKRYAIDPSQRPALISRTVFSRWKLDVPLSEFMFKTNPPPGSRLIKTTD